ncbi:hypothetical protein PM082_012428 [Marasmius tenuissimus]|nr:hypothetical protein PM082_012428 [Marasmius tenuissimus]
MQVTNDSGRVSELLRAEFITVLLSAQSRIFDHNEVDTKPEYTFSYSAHLILQQISSFLVYPRILHCILRSCTKIQSPELEEDFKRNSKELWEYWETIKRRAVTYRELRRIFKEQKFFGAESLCTYPQCPLKDVSSAARRDQTGHTAANTRYFRCSTCLAVVYCSPSCREKDWDVGHRQGCKLITDKRHDITKLEDYEIPRYDLRSFVEFVRVYAGIFSQDLWKIVERYREELSRECRQNKGNRDLPHADTLSIINRERNPIVVVDFGKPEGLFAPEETFQISNITRGTFTGPDCADETIVRGLKPQFITEFVLPNWRKTGRENVFFTSFVPRKGSISFPVAQVFNFGLQATKGSNSPGASSQDSDGPKGN